MMNSYSPSSSDEISLVDLVVLLVRRWKLMLAVFAMTLLAAIAVALMWPTTYTYTSLYAIAETQDDEGKAKPLEAANALLARLRLQIQPSEVRQLLADKRWHQLPFDLSFSQPQGTGLIALTTQAQESQQEAVEQLHRELLDALAHTQQTLVERTERSLTYRLEALRSAIQQVGVVDGNLTAAVSRLEAQLTALQAGEVSQLAVRSLEPQGVSAWLVVVAGVLAGLVLAIVAAFGSHFSGAVRQRLTHG
ncbi:Wzz/FepE/Etk N-terminal domain-containing protein [Modicisalibacter xianhensis]|uniref:Chain length determinant protein n=1 Tax=Modicisalibacter xianhensis TaxID=442341 RepID=A0A1I3C7G2_9GAMM|nr:Wzz/FepE/Etk N-terminal domain-containing protein [Halomonas xianhensis]SFH70256.1 Chain length determinant protein [Halomonas xianhensis]